VNTPFVEAVNQGINHSEGGWPKDVSATDAEQTSRYRRKLEKDEQFAVQIMSVAAVRILYTFNYFYLLYYLMAYSSSAIYRITCV